MCASLVNEAIFITLSPFNNAASTEEKPVGIDDGMCKNPTEAGIDFINKHKIVKLDKATNDKHQNQSRSREKVHRQIENR